MCIRDRYLVPYDWNIDWIEKEIDAMVSLMNNDKIPEPNLSCKTALILSNMPSWSVTL